MYLDEARTRAFIKVLMEAYENRVGIFATHHHENRGDAGGTVQRLYMHPDVEAGSGQHLARLTVINWFDTMSVSTALHRAFWREAWSQRGFFAFEDIRMLFDERALSLKAEDIRWLFSKVGISFPNARVLRFQHFAQDFFGRLEGDAKRIFTLGTTIGEIDAYRKAWQDDNRKKRYFLPGYGPKLLSLLALYFYDFGAHTKVFPGAFPVDRHFQRLLLQSRALVPEGITSASTVAEFVRSRIVHLLKEMHVHAFVFAHAMWLLGSNLCASCQRTSETPPLMDPCPIRVGTGFGGTCTGGLSTGEYRTEGRWGSGKKEGRKDPRQFDLPL